MANNLNAAEATSPPRSTGVKQVHHKLDTDVIEVLNAAEIAGNQLVIKQRLDRDLYVRANKAIELLGGQWSRKAQAHVFPEGTDIKGLFTQATAAGTVVDAKQTYQFFQTPEALVARMISLADLRPGVSILEPSAGHGAIARRVHERMLQSSFIDMVEIDPAKVDGLRRMGIGHVIEGDFLTCAKSGQYDRIIANPPFTRGQDVEHIMAMFDCLKPGGRLVSVASAGVAFRTDRKTMKLRQLIAQVGGQIIELGEGIFDESGTSVRTVLVVMDKPV